MWMYGLLAAESGFWMVVSLCVFAALIFALTAQVCITASKDNFRWSGFFFILILATFYIFGVFNVVEFVRDHYIWVIVVFAIYLAGSYPYTRLIEWRRHKLPELYKQRKEREAREADSFRLDFLRKRKDEWIEAQRLAFWARRDGGEVQSETPAESIKSRRLSSKRERGWHESNEYQRQWQESAEYQRLDQEWEVHEKTFDVEGALKAYLIEHGYDKPISSSEYKSWILGYMAWWPFKMLHRLLVKWVLEFFDRIWDLINAIYKTVEHKFQADSDREFQRQRQETVASSSTPSSKRAVI